MYDDYQTAGADFYSFIIGFGTKDSLTTYVNQHPEFHCSEWLWDGYQTAWPHYRDMFGLGNYVPSHFIIDRDGYVRYGVIGGVGSNPAPLQNCINELL